MMWVAKQCVGRMNIILVILLFVCVRNFVNGSLYDEKQSPEYTEAILNITYCDNSGKKCHIKPYDGSGKFGLHSPKHGSKGWLYTLIENNVNGCKEFNVNVDKSPWIALIERGVCNFKEKIGNAYKPVWWYCAQHGMESKPISDSFGYCCVSIHVDFARWKLHVSSLFHR